MAQCCGGSTRGRLMLGVHAWTAGARCLRDLQCVDACQASPVDITWAIIQIVTDRLDMQWTLPHSMHSSQLRRLRHIRSIKNHVYLPICKTRSQAVARIADRTASKHLWGHVTIWYSIMSLIFLLVVGTESLNPAVFEILRSKRIGSRVWRFKVTWRHLIAHMQFPVEGPLEPSL